jgi:excisionase family DNA binding protein
MAEGDEWMDAEAAARYLDFHPNTIYQMVRDGRLPALRFPVRIRRSDLDGVLERCRIKPGELAHLNAYARGEHRASERSTTKAGRPDRRYGPRSRTTG